jgi:hypothetical protein
LVAFLNVNNFLKCRTEIQTVLVLSKDCPCWCFKGLHSISWTYFFSVQWCEILKSVLELF